MLLVASVSSYMDPTPNPIPWVVCQYGTVVINVILLVTEISDRIMIGMQLNNNKYASLIGMAVHLARCGAGVSSAELSGTMWSHLPG